MKNKHKKHLTIGKMAIILLGVFSFPGYAQTPKLPKYEPDIVDKQEKKVTQNYKETPFGGFVEKMPQFPGGELELLKFIQSNIQHPNVNYPCEASYGKVIVRFVVTKNGDVSKVEILRSLDPWADKEAIRVVKLLPKFTPGEQNGKKVDVWYTLPVFFKL